MKIFTLFFTLISLSIAALNTSREYFIKTELKPTAGYGKSGYDNLWLYVYLSP